MLIGHITDPHIGFHSDELGERIDPVRGLRDALAHLRRLRPSPDVLLLTGDLTEHGREADYRTLVALLDEAVPGHAHAAPRVLAVPGNHDVPARAHACLGARMPLAGDAPHGRCCVEAVHGELVFLGLDTVQAGQPHGVLDAAQLAWLERALARHAGQPVVIFMHHPPLVTGIQAMDACGLLQGAEALGRLVRAHGGVQLIASGHMHRPIAGALGGAPVVVAPSSSHQIELDLRAGAQLAMRLEPPMIGLYHWSAQGAMACHFSHVHAFDGPYPV